MRQVILWRWALATMLCVLVCLSGCAKHAILIPSGEPVRLRETVKAAKVWVRDKDGVDTPTEMDLPEGWYCLPDPGPDR